MAQKGSELWERPLLFRNYLREHPEEADEYYRLKKRLAAKMGASREAYTAAKTEFIESVLAKAEAGAT